MKKRVTVVLAISVALSFAPPTVAADKNPYGTSNVDPAGPNEIVFSVSKGTRTADFTLSKLLKMKSRTISIYEPFIKKRQRFTVIPIQSFFASVGISGDDKVRTTALNDYIYANSASQFVSANAYIAIKRDGSPIPYDQGGPLRLVFSDQSKWAKFLDAWNWSLASISVK